MKTNDIKYIVISPVRNEESNIEKTILSVLSQTIRPLKWVIVDDGSSDRTIEIIEKYTQTNKWISLLKLPDRGYYDLMTGGEIKAFYRGFETVKDLSYDFLSKLDGDISFDEHYYENLFKEFDLNKRLGIASGVCYHYEGDSLVLEKCHNLHVRGAARAYRRACWDAIGGVIDNLGWDAIDVYKARMLGWETYSFDHLKMTHHVKTWTKGGLIHGRMRSGRMEYLMGTHPLFFAAKVVRELAAKPYLVRACAFIIGYLRSSISKDERVVDNALMAYIRQEQLLRFGIRCNRTKERKRTKLQVSSIKRGLDNK